MTDTLYRMTGSKSRIVDDHIRIIRLIMRDRGITKFRRWVELFGGTWTVALAAMRADLAEVYYLGDSNLGMVSVLKQLQTQPDALISIACEFLAKSFEEQRAAFMAQRNPRDILKYSTLDLAIRHLVLRGCSFNALMRTNKKGVYNVPFGLEYLNKKTKLVERSAPHIRLEDLLVVSELLRKHVVHIHCADFRQTIQHAGLGDYVYADPPYWGTHSSFGPKKFDEKEHRALSIELAAAKLRGSECGLAGSDCPETRSIYGGEEVIELFVNRSTSSKASTRGKIKELFIRI